MKYCIHDSPIGALLLAGDDGVLQLIALPGDHGHRDPGQDWIESPAVFTTVRRQLDEYFAGRRRAFDVQLSPHGTPFQLAVLDALREIPYGETRSYRDIAVRVGRPRAVRAVGAANGRNPLPIVIPCHRVIGANGSLTGFGGGLPAKAYLLALESGRRELF